MLPQFHQLVKQAAEERLDVYFPEIKLQKGTSGSVEVSGSGNLRQSPGRGAVLTVYTKDHDAALKLQPSTGQVGREVPTDELCHAVGTDSTGLEWRVTKHMIHGVTTGTIDYASVSMRPFELSVLALDEDIASSPTNLVVTLPSEKVPWVPRGNHIEEGAVTGTLRRSRGGSHPAVDQLGLFGESQEWADVYRIQSGQPVSPSTAGWAVSNALTWCLGRHVHWLAATSGHSLALQPRPRDVGSWSWWKPVHNQVVPERRESWWRMAALTTARMLKQDDHASRLLARISRQLVSAARSGPEAEASALVFGVEALVQQVAQPGSDSVPPEVDALVDRWRHEVDSCTSAIPQRWASRLKGLLGQINAPASPTQLLRDLAERGIVGTQHPTAWKNLRQRVVHVPIGGTVSTTDGEWMAFMEPVATCLNRLFFNVVGYSGPYTDFAITGWPTVHPDGRIEPD